MERELELQSHMLYSLVSLPQPTRIRNETTKRLRIYAPLKNDDQGFTPSPVKVDSNAMLSVSGLNYRTIRNQVFRDLTCLQSVPKSTTPVVSRSEEHTSE